MRGDTSGNVVHPFFVHFSNAVGMHFRAGVEDSPAMLQLQARHAHQVLKHMSEAGKSNNAGLITQILLCTTAGCLFQRLFRPTRIYLKKACDTINAANLRFIPVFGRPPELTEEVQERLAVLSQAIYLENYLYLAIDRAPPTMTAQIEREFRHELQVGGLALSLPMTQPDYGTSHRKPTPACLRSVHLPCGHKGFCWSRTQYCSSTCVRLAVSDFVLTSTSVNPPRFNAGAKPGGWHQMRDQLVTRLDEYSETLLRNLRRFLEVGDRRGAEVIQRTCVACLAHLAMLCDRISRLDPNSKPQMDAVCDSSLERLGHLSQDMRIDRYTYLDILLGVRHYISLVPTPKG